MLSISGWRWGYPGVMIVLAIAIERLAAAWSINRDHLFMADDWSEFSEAWRRECGIIRVHGLKLAS